MLAQLEAPAGVRKLGVDDLCRVDDVGVDDGDAGAFIGGRRVSERDSGN